MHEKTSLPSPAPRFSNGGRYRGKIYLEPSLGILDIVLRFFHHCSIPVCLYLRNLSQPEPYHGDSARLLLSALIQSESTIIALVITLTLIAVQLTAASYTPRVANIFCQQSSHVPAAGDLYYLHRV